MKRTPLKRKTELSRKQPMSREPGANRPLSPGPRRAVAKKRSVYLSEAWWELVAKGQPCIVCGRRGGIIDAHHVLPKKLLRSLGRDDLTMDPRNGIPVHRNRHDQHESGYLRLPRSILPPAAIEFAREIDQEWRLDKLYPES